MSTNAKRRNPQNNNPYLAGGAVAIALTIPSAIIAFLCGVILMFTYKNVLVAYGQCAGGFIIAAAVMSVVSFCLGIVAIVKNKKFALASSFLSLIATLLIVCSLGVTGFDYYTIGWEIFISVAAVASALSLTSFILFAVYYAKAPIKTVYYKHSRKDEKLNLLDVALKRIARLSELYRDGILTADEFSAQKKKLLSHLNNKDDGNKKEDEDKQSTRLSKKKTLRLVLVPILILVILCGGVVTGLQFACCESVYGEIEYEMAHPSNDMVVVASYDSGFSTPKMEYLLYYMWPYDYKDVDSIRYEYFEVSDYLNLRGNVNASGDDIRRVYRRLVDKKANGWLDPRWDLSNILTFCEQLLYSATWSSGDDYIQFAHMSYYQQSFFTNLPNTVPEYFADQTLYYYTSFNDDELVIGYYAGYNLVAYDSYGISNFVYDYESDTFSVEVYCYANDTTYTMTME